MSLELYSDPDDLYLARGQDVNPRRPLFTGDVFADVPIPGAQTTGPVIVVSHPCTIRGGRGQLKDHVLVAPVVEHRDVGREKWVGGHYGLMPLPDLAGGVFHAARLDELGRTRTEDLHRGRLACLSPFGVNLLQQRLIWHLTRFEVETHVLFDAFGHTFDEADLLEEWSDTQCDAGLALADAAALFENYIRADRGDGRTLQSDLSNPQLRAGVRSALRAEARRLVAEREEGNAGREGVEKGPGA